MPIRARCSSARSTASIRRAIVDADVSVKPSKIAGVRTGPVAPNSDGDVHSTTSVAVAKGILYASVGSSCNACREVDGTRAVILQMGLDGSNLATKATRIRNAVALAPNTDTGTLWAGNAGQDDLPRDILTSSSMR